MKDKVSLFNKEITQMDDPLWSFILKRVDPIVV